MGRVMLALISARFCCFCLVRLNQGVLVSMHTSHAGRGELGLESDMFWLSGYDY